MYRWYAAIQYRNGCLLIHSSARGKEGIKLSQKTCSWLAFKLSGGKVTMINTICRAVLLSALVLLPFCVYPQQNDTLASAVVVSQSKADASLNAKFAPGTRVERYAKIQHVTAGNSLSDFLQRETALYVKEYGRGMSSYLAIRGTSSTHTSIDWNGQSLLVPTLGQADLSHIPTYFFDNMTIHVGGNSALYGNGSMGGSIQLRTAPKFEKGADGDITLKAGSFYTFFGGATLRYATENEWESRTSAYYSYSKNNFRFKNNSKWKIPWERQNNAQYNNYGILQEFAKRFKDESVLQLSFVYLDFDRQIQPSVSTNDSDYYYHTVLDRNVKANALYSGNSGIWRYRISAAYNYDYELYEGDIIAADRFSVSMENQLSLKKVLLDIGGRSEYIKPDVDAYAAGTDEWRTELFVLALYNPNDRLTLGGGLRGTFVTDLSVPLQPTVNMKYKIKEGLSLRASASGSVKVPTLNDRYWGGEAVYLEPEKGQTYEAGADYSTVFKGWRVNSYLTYYYSPVKDWIRWLPAGEVWRPRNIPKVISDGAEAGFDAVKTFGAGVWRVGARYAYTNVTMRKSRIENDPGIGHQIAFQPKHTFMVKIGYERGRVESRLVGSFTGRRTSSDINDIMKSYFLLNAYVKYKLGRKVILSGELNNILNVSYQNVKFYAMPGFNFSLGAQIKFKN